MSSGFTSGGSLDKPIERDDEWLKAQKELAAERTRKAEIQRQQAGKSLYEVLQSNKAAKQEQFEESIKLKNQFRTLDDDEIDFLESVLEKERSTEAAIKQETSEQLHAFRKQQIEEESQAKLQVLEPATVEVSQSWTVGKRKRSTKEGIHGVKFSKLVQAVSKRQPDTQQPSEEFTINKSATVTELPSPNSTKVPTDKKDGAEALSKIVRAPKQHVRLQAKDPDTAHASRLSFGTSSTMQAIEVPADGFTCLELLRVKLPSSIAIYRRIQSKKRTSQSHIYASHLP